MTRLTQRNVPHDLASVQALCTTTASTSSAASMRVQRNDHSYSLGLGLSSRCNFHCPMCYYHGADDSNAPADRRRDMPLSLLQTILADLPILDRIIIGLEGEPFCYPHIFQALDMMRPKTDSFALVTNGSLLTEERCRCLATYPISLLSLSIDAADTASYALFRSGGDLATFKKHAAQSVRYFQDAVSLHTVIFAENIHTVPAMPTLAAELGIPRLSLQQLRPHMGAQHRGIHPAPAVALRQCLT